MNILQSNSSNLVFCRTFCKNHLIDAIVDTGSGITVVSPSLCRELKLNSKPWTGPRISLADRNLVISSGVVNLDLEVGGKLIRVDAAILDLNGYPLLLGNDSLQQLEILKIDYREGSNVTFASGKDFDIITEPTVSVSLISSSDQTIPAYSAIPIKFKIPFEKKETKFCKVFEPSTTVFASKGLTLGRFLLSKEHSSEEITLFLTNFSHQDQILNEGTVLGQFEEVEAVGELDSDFTKTQLKDFDFEQVVNHELPSEDRQAVIELLKRYSRCFARSSTELGCSNVAQHIIQTNHPFPIHQPPYPSAWKARANIQTQVDEMLEAGVIEPPTSPWASPVVLIKKKDGSWRFCVDYRKLNSITIKDVYPLPRIEDALSRLEGSFLFSIMDMQSGYWQVEMNPKDREKTAFITADGLFQFRVMPFGLSNAPSTFQRMMDVLLAGLKWNACLVYLDDIIVFSSTVDEHLSRLEAVFKCIQKANLKLKLSKCSFLATRLKILGYW